MRFITSIVAVVVAACPIFVYAAPTILRRHTDAFDITVLKFAEILEQLEGQFYKDALTKFKEADFVTAGFPSSQAAVEQFQVIQEDENTHSTALRVLLKALGQEPITSCKFNFDPVLKDVATMAAVARIVEVTGVGAYLGATPLIKDPSILVASSSILTVEARHQTILNILSNGTAIPSAFDVGLTPNEVLSIASPFIDGPCDLGVQANPPLTVTTNSTLTPGTKLTFSAPTLNNTNQDTAFCQMIVGGLVNSISLPLNECIIPSQGIDGPVFLWITSDNQPLLNNVNTRATSQLVAGPTIIFVDTKSQLLGQLARLNPSNPKPITTISTATLSPGEVVDLVPSSTQSSPSSTSTVAVVNLSPSTTPSPLEVDNPYPNSSPSSTASGASPSEITLVPAS